ncbi:secretion protein HlyD, partial [bacterium]|nr:secretion protein HlyD [bacterium]
GEFAPAQIANNPLIILGNTEIMNIRVDIDENDAWRIKPNAKASASLRGNKDIKTDLEFVRIEPYVIPKKSLTGQSTERVDTRVLQVMYAFPKGAMNAYVGQLVDVHINGE